MSARKVSQELFHADLLGVLRGAFLVAQRSNFGLESSVYFRSTVAPTPLTQDPLSAPIPPMPQPVDTIEVDVLQPTLMATPSDFSMAPAEVSVSPIATTTVAGNAPEAIPPVSLPSEDIARVSVSVDPTLPLSVPLSSTPIISQTVSDATPRELSSSPPLPPPIAPASILSTPIPPPSVTSSTPISSTMSTTTSSGSPIAPASKPLLRERKVPVSAASRVAGFGGLAVGLLWGTVGEAAKRAVRSVAPSLVSESTNKGNNNYSVFVSPENADRIAETLCRMRGAALKVGQLLSIQDESLVPAPIVAALERARQGADVMPQSQLDAVMKDELGENWRNKVREFDPQPFAAASLGQVHRAVTHNGEKVAMKIQYPGVAKSINSDLANLKRLLTFAGAMPKGLYIDEAIAVAREELTRECDYTLEAENQLKFISFVGPNNPEFVVPAVFPELSSRGVLTSEFVTGQAVDKFIDADQSTRDRIARLVLKMTLQELFMYRFMQTDPNFSNFLYDPTDMKLRLLDFGACRPFPKKFVDDYLRLVIACAEKNREKILEYSIALGFITGAEDRVLMDTHVKASYLVGEPFARNEPFDFKASNVTSRVADFGKLLIEHRLTPPPQEAYSLHRRLSGAFLMCLKLSAKINCRDLLYDIYGQYDFDK